MRSYLLQKQPTGQVRSIEKPESLPPAATDGPGTYWLTDVATGETLVVVLQQAGPPVLVRPPAIAGVAEVGETLLGDPGAWLDAATVRIGWYRAGTLLSRSARYLVASADIGEVLRFSVEAANDAGAITASAVTAAVTAGSVTVPADEIYALAADGSPEFVALVDPAGDILAVTESAGGIVIDVADAAVIAETATTITIEIGD